MEQVGKKNEKSSLLKRALSPTESLKATMYAIQGIRYALNDSSFLRLVIVQGIIILLLILFLWPLSLIEIAVLLPAFALPLCTELINVAVESIVDLVHPSTHELAGKAKDCAAGATCVATTLWLIAVALVSLNHFSFN